MVDMYVKLITNGTGWSLQRVPSKYRSQVEEKLIGIGFEF